MGQKLLLWSITSNVHLSRWR